jgi:hypothetical protein
MISHVEEPEDEILGVPGGKQKPVLFGCQPAV